MRVGIDKIAYEFLTINLCVVGVPYRERDHNILGEFFVIKALLSKI